MKRLIPFTIALLFLIPFASGSPDGMEFSLMSLGVMETEHETVLESYTSLFGSAVMGTLLTFVVILVVMIITTKYRQLKAVGDEQN